MKKNNNFLTLIIVGLLLISGYFIYSTYNKNPKKSSETSTSPSAEETIADNNQNSFSGTVTFADTTQDKTDIFTKAVKTNEQKKIFTDKDESEKIKSFGGLTNNNLINVFMRLPNQQYSGTLYNITTDSSGKKEKLISDFASTQAAKISPDGKKIAYTLFSNAEKDYGFRLIISNSDGTSKKELVTDDTNLIIYSWNPDSNQICYTKGAKDNEFKLYTINIENSKEQELTNIKGQIYNLNWGKDDLFVVSMKDTDQAVNQAELYKFTNKKTKLIQITKDDNYQNQPIISDDGKYILYYQVKYDNNQVSQNLIGDILLSDTNGENIIKIGTGNVPIGFLK